MCLNYKHCGDDTIIVGVYVYDLLVTASKRVLVNDFFKAMGVLSIKDRGEVSKFLSMRVVLKDGPTCWTSKPPSKSYWNNTC